MTTALESPVSQLSVSSAIPVVIQSDESGPTTPLVQTVAIPLADTEQSLALPAGCQRFLVRVRDGKLSLAYAAGGPYLVIGAGGALSSEAINPAASVTLYYKSSKAADLLQVETWA